MVLPLFYSFDSKIDIHWLTFCNLLNCCYL